jgi:hypothetical protein
MKLLRMTEQEMFDKVARHLLTQGCKSQTAEPSRMVFGTAVHYCLYRGPEGRKCAIGALIPNWAYRKSMESKIVDMLVAEYALMKWLIPHPALAHELQLLHDTVVVENWPIELRRTAERHGLNTEVVDELSPPAPVLVELSYPNNEALYLSSDPLGGYWAELNARKAVEKAARSSKGFSGTMEVKYINHEALKEAFK